MTDREPDLPKSSLLAELRRRKVFRAGAGYAVTSFVLLQLLDATADALGISPGSQQVILAILVVGFPTTLTMAWFFETTPQGLVVEKSTQFVRQHGRRIEIAMLLLLFVAMGLAAYLIVKDVPASSRLRIAVLPFDNFTGDAANEYISDGITEELLDGLHNISSLVVLPKTVSFYYKGKNVDFRTIAETLDVDLILEGSLLDRDGNRLRVSAQLIGTSTQEHLWSKIYDQELGSLIRVKRNIVDSVVKALSLQVSDSPATARLPASTSNGEAYDLFLQANDYMRRADSRADHEIARDLYRSAYALDKEFSAAKAGECSAEVRMYTMRKEAADYHRAVVACTRVLSGNARDAYSQLAVADLTRVAGNCTEALTMYQLALELDPALEPAYFGAARCQETLGKFSVAEDHYLAGINLETRNWQAHFGYSGFLQRQGRYAEAAEVSRRMTNLTPDNGWAWSNLGSSLLLSGHLEEARKAWQRGHELDRTPHSYVNLATALYYQRRFKDEIILLSEAAARFPESYRIFGKLGAAYRSLPDKQSESMNAYKRAIALAEAAVQVNPSDSSVLGYLSTFFASIDNFEQAHRSINRALELEPANPELHYYQAIVWKLAGDQTRTDAAVAKAIAMGYSGELISHDPLLTVGQGS